MHCDEARLDLALWVGHDLDDRARIEELRRHIATCPQCRSRTKSLQASMVALGTPDPDPTFDRADSLWPDLISRIEYLEASPSSPSHWNAWGLALCGMVIGMVAAWFWLNPSKDSSSPPPTAPSSHQPSTTPAEPYLSPGDSPGTAVLPDRHHR